MPSTYLCGEPHFWAMLVAATFSTGQRTRTGGGAGYGLSTRRSVGLWTTQQPSSRENQYVGPRAVGTSVVSMAVGHSRVARELDYDGPRIG